MKPFKEYHLFQLLDQLDPAYPLDLSISQYFKQNKSLGSKDRKFIAETTYSMVRWLALIDSFIQTPKTWEKRYEAFKEIDIEKSIQETSIPIHIRCSCPKFLFSKLVENFGEKKAFEIALKCNERAPLIIRVNELKISRDAFYNKMSKEYPFVLCDHSPCGLRLETHFNLFQTEEFKSGEFEVQDEASQLVAYLVQVKEKQKVLDYCSGSGGKTLAIAPKMKTTGCIYLHDIRPGILKQAKKRFKRAGIQNYQIALPDSRTLKNLKQNMDWVLVDAPCTGTGTYRRNPDLKWKFDEKMLSEIITLQREIFDAAIQYLKPNGCIVYATCSLLKDENEDQTEFFKQKYGLKIVSNPLNSANEFGTMDGFYGVVLTRC